MIQSAVDPGDEIEVVDSNNGLWASIRTYEKRPAGRDSESTIQLSPDQLVEHALECLKLAVDMKERR